MFHNVFGKRETVLRLSSGDTIITSTADAHGFDSQMREVAQRPNPLTGPFFVDGAQPGDTLAVDLEKITPNRREGWSSNSIDPSIVDPSFAGALPEKEYVQWQVDAKGRRLILRDQGWKHARLQLPMEPMLGCIGVAPKEGQLLSSMTSAEHGGNMDWRGCREGTRVYLPVFEEGALLYIGDGHAVQSDGEIGGTGVEISMTVRLSVHLLKQKKITWPRAEDSICIYTIGNARPLFQALQHATTEMIRWLADEFQLDTISASILMSQCVRYELANVFDPAYSAVCKLEKTYLSNSGVLD